MKKIVFLFTFFFCANNLIIAQITPVGSPINGSENNIGAGASLSYNNDGSIIAVGFMHTTAYFLDQGMARVFELQNGEWIQKGSDLGNQYPDDRGFHVSLNGEGNILAMSTGSVFGDNNSNVTVYEFINNDWQLIGSPIDITDGYAQLNNVGDTVIVSNLLNNPIVYEFINDSWQQKGSITVGDGEFGLFASDINSLGNIIATYVLENGSSTVRIYKYEANQWNTIGNIDTIAYNLLSLSISLSSSGETCLITSLLEDNNEDLYLESKIYKYENENWTQAGNSIITSPTEEFIHIENISAINATGNIVAIGNPIDNGNVMLYKLINNQWTSLGEGISGNGGEFGRAISLNEDASTLAIGAPIFSDIGFYFGQITTYEIDYNLFSTEDNLYSTDIIIHPNPVKDLLQITSQNNSTINKISVYDISGKLALEENDTINQVDISNLPIGLFFVKIETEKGIVTKKIIKQ